MKNSMRLTLRYVHDGAERTVAAGPAAIVAFERHWAVGIGRALADARVEHLAWLAHQAALREAQAGNGPAVKPFDDWLAGLDDLEVADGSDDAAPLDGTP